MKTTLFSPRRLSNLRLSRPLLLVLGGIICAFLVYSSVFPPQDQPVAETTGEMYYHQRVPRWECRDSWDDECPWAQACDIPRCGKEQIAWPCCNEGIEPFGYVCEICGGEVN